MINGLAAMSVYRKANSKWYCQFMIKGERIHKLLDGAKNRQEAKELEDAERFKIRQQQNGIIKEEKKITLEFMMNRYVKVSEANNRCPDKARIYRKHAFEFFGKNKDINQIKPSDIDRYKLYCLELGRSKSTVNRYIAGLKRAFNILIDDEIITYNPCHKVKMFEEDNRRYRYLSKEEWERLKLHLNPVTFKIVTVALQTGFRKQNVLQLRWEQIDFNLRTIELLKSENKGKKKIITPMTQTLYELLQSLEPKPSGYVFVNPDTGKPYTDIKKSFSNALEKACIEDFKFHDLRRTVGTWLLSSGVDIRTVQNILAHSEVRTTERYLALTPEQNKKAMDVLNSYM